MKSNSRFAFIVTLCRKCVDTEFMIERERQKERDRNKPKLKKKLAGVVHFFFWLFIMYEIRNDVFDPLPISVCCTVIIICKYIRLHIGTGFHIGRRMVIHKIKYKRSYIIHFYKLDSSTKHAVLWFKWISYSSFFCVFVFARYLREKSSSRQITHTQTYTKTVIITFNIQ